MRPQPLDKEPLESIGSAVDGPVGVCIGTDEGAASCLSFVKAIRDGVERPSLCRRGIESGVGPELHHGVVRGHSKTEARCMEENAAGGRSSVEGVPKHREPVRGGLNSNLVSLS